MSTDKTLHPPLQVWKLLLLMLATGTLYQFVWLYRTAQDIKATRDPSITPWHWAVIPFLGPFIVVPGLKIAVYLRDWQVEGNKEPGHLAEPVIVGMLMLVAYLPMMMIIVEVTAYRGLLLLSTLILSLSYLILNGQLNNNKEPVAEQVFRSAPWQFEKTQLLVAVFGAIVAVPLYLTVFTDVRETYYAVDLHDGALVRAQSGHVQVRVLDPGWSRVGDKFKSAEAELEFYGPDEWTMAVVYDVEGSSVDEVLAFRQTSVREDYSRASCSLHKSIVEDNWTVIGTLVCEGRSPIDGDYIYASRVMRRDESIFELLAYTSQSDPSKFAAISPRVRRFSEGLELSP
jgi:hypothetical protein